MIVGAWLLHDCRGQGLVGILYYLQISYGGGLIIWILWEMAHLWDHSKLMGYCNLSHLPTVQLMQPWKSALLLQTFLNTSSNKIHHLCLLISSFHTVFEEKPFFFFFPCISGMLSKYYVFFPKSNSSWRKAENLSWCSTTVLWKISRNFKLKSSKLGKVRLLNITQCDTSRCHLVH